MPPKKQQQQQGPNKKTAEKNKAPAHTKDCYTCPVCDEEIVDASEQNKGQDSVFCVGVCSTWLHRQCVGLSSQAFKVLGESTRPYSCPHCELDSQKYEITSLKNEIASLKSVLTTFQENTVSPPVLTTRNVPVSSTEDSSMSYVAALQSSIASVSKELHTANNKSEKKFNIIAYGFEECPDGTRKDKRIAKDHENTVGLLQVVDSSLNKHSIRDCFRLGKYVKNKRKPRPLLIKLTCVQSVTSVLANSNKLSSSQEYREISIKRDMTKIERDDERLLLEERYQLIKSGTPRTDIKIKGKRLFLKNKEVGSVINRAFVPTSNSSHLSHSPHKQLLSPPSPSQNPLHSPEPPSSPPSQNTSPLPFN